MTSADVDRESISRSIVRMPRQGLPGGVIAALAIAAAFLLFVVLNAQRRQRAVVRGAPTDATFTAPPPLGLPPEPSQAPSPVPAQPPTIITTPLPRLPAPASAVSPQPPLSAPVPTIIAAPPSAPTNVAPSEEAPQRRLNAPALVVDAAGDTTDPPASAPTAATGTSTRGAATQDDSPARAGTIRNQSYTVPIGTLIPIVLETPIDTARPGLVRAVASGDTRGFDGRHILIPRGSRLIGEYQADIRPGQNRVLVGWTRLVRPDGVTMRLGSPAADELGGAGVPGRVNTFFFQRFASAILQSALTVGVNIASRPRAGSVVVGLPTSPLTNLGQNLLPGSELRPKITVKQGAQLNVFVARDLDFTGTGARRP